MYSNEPVAQEHYYDSKNDEVDMYYYIAIDNGKSNNDSLDTHDLIWTSFDDVYKTLSYDSLKKIWLEVKKLILKIIEDEK